MTSAAPLVEVDGISKSFGAGETAVRALDDVSLVVRPREVVALLGPSGSGKSTLLNVIGCILEPTQGRLRLDGETVFDGRWLRGDLRALRLMKIGFIFQFHYLLPEFTALENVMLPALIAGMGRSAAEAQAKDLLGFVGLGKRLSHRPSELSGGEQQRVAIARAMASEPQIIFADEPTGNLDTATGHAIIELIFARRAALGATLLIITHDPELADHCDRVVVMHDGRIEERAA